METIYTYHATKNELAEIDLAYPDLSEAEYLKDIERRAKSRNSTVEYESVVDLQYLFKLRKDQEKLNHYTSLLEDKMIDITNRVYNE